MTIPINSPRVLIIGAGSRGHAYARAIHQYTSGTIVGVAEPIEWKRNDFVKRYAARQFVYSSWNELLSDAEHVKAGVDAICVCTLDETHAEIVTAFRPLNLHMLCEKPLATTFDDCQRMLRSIQTGGIKPIIFAVGHVLRYSPHNILLHKLVAEDEIIGNVININHTEPVGWWHFAHSYVRGNWRSSHRSAPSLLTKCCHDIDLLLWILCSPTKRRMAPHLPTRISSHGSLVHFRPSRKPTTAGVATNCFSCPAEPECIYSAKSIYITRQLHGRGNISNWPNKIVVPTLEDVEDIPTAEKLLTTALSQDYTPSEAGTSDVENREFYGRCVFDAGNDVVDNQVVVMEWEDMITSESTSSPSPSSPSTSTGPKTATLTMIAHSERICERFTQIYGSKGTITADSQSIRVYDFASDTAKVYIPSEHLDETAGHGGGDVGLAMAFVEAVREVLQKKQENQGDEKDETKIVKEAQKKWIRCTPEEAVLGHALVFAAEEARTGRKVVDVDEWTRKWKVDTTW